MLIVSGWQPVEPYVSVFETNFLHNSDFCYFSQSQIIAVPVDQYSDDLITPALKCVKMASGE